MSILIYELVFVEFFVVILLHTLPPLDSLSVSNNPSIACSIAGTLCFCRGPVPGAVDPMLPMAATLSSVGPAVGRPDPLWGVTMVL